MGPTKVYHAQFTAPESIRGRFGLTDTRNATHGSGMLCSQFLKLPEQ
jgi:nucleoside-diphosphate kinase